MELQAIETLRKFEPLDGYFLAFSGGKDSITCYKLLELSGVRYESHYSMTTIDEPFVKPFIRQYYPSVIFDRPELSMFQLITKKGGMPLRISRYCCELLKEYSGKGRTVVTGIRNDESFNRSKRHLLEIDSRKRFKGKAYVNPIIRWNVNDVWDFISKYKMKVPDYYAEDCRSARGGCVGCPLAGTENMKRDFIKYPRYKAAYLKAIQKAIALGRFKQFENNFDVFDWWVSGLSVKHYHESKKQLMMF